MSLNGNLSKEIADIEDSGGDEDSVALDFESSIL
jgi:hypothetical protein